MPSIWKRLRDLSYKTQPTSADNEAFARQLLGGDDRGVALLLATNLENALDAALLSVLKIGTDDMETYFESDGPLATLARKAAMASALRITGPITSANLRALRLIRNAFAHAKSPIEFDTPLITEACAELVMVNPMGDADRSWEKESMTPRDLFQDVCTATAFMLRVYSTAALLMLPRTDLRAMELYADRDLYMQKKQLP